MPNKKPTDNEVIKALECCVNKKTCENCPYSGRSCMTPLKRDTLALINRLQVRVDHYYHNMKHLVKSVRGYQKALEQAKAEKEVLEARIGVYETCNARKDEAIRKLEAENERLLQKTQRPQDVDPMDFCGVLCDFAEGLIAKAKTEARKEFAERLKRKACMHNHKECSFPDIKVICLWDIDRLLEELEKKENE